MWIKGRKLDCAEGQFAPIEKKEYFFTGEVFFLLTRPLMGAYEKVSQEKHFTISKKYIFSYLRSPVVIYPLDHICSTFFIP